jgi:solute carrier family 35, member E1
LIAQSLPTFCESFSFLFNPILSFLVYNKRVLAVWPAPLTLGSLQLDIGALYATAIWNLGLRKRPQLKKKKSLPFVKVGMCNAFGQLCTMATLDAGSVEFTNIVKVCRQNNVCRCEIHDHMRSPRFYSASFTRSWKTYVFRLQSPFFAGVSILVFGKLLHPLVYATLIPVVGGVGYACLNQPSFFLARLFDGIGQ